MAPIVFNKKELRRTQFIDDNKQIVGVITSNYPLSTNDVDVVIIDIDSSYEKRMIRMREYQRDDQSFDTFTVAKCISGSNKNRDVDIVSPIIGLINGTNVPLSVIASNQACTVVNNDSTEDAVYKQSKYSEIILTIDQPPNENYPNIPNKIRLDLPLINLLNKDIFVRTFNVWISTKSITTLRKIIEEFYQTSDAEKGFTNVVSVKAEGPIDLTDSLFISVNGIRTHVNIDFVDKDKIDVIVSNSFDSTNMVCQIDPKELSDKSIHHNLGGIYDIIVDVNQQRLFETQNDLLPTLKEAAVNGLLLKNSELSHEIVKINDQRQEEINKLVVTNEKLEKKLSEVEAAHRVKINELSLKKEEVKLAATSVDAEGSIWTTNVKLGTALVGLAGLVASLIIKVGVFGGAVKSSNMVEWAFGLGLSNACISTKPVESIFASIFASIPKPNIHEIKEFLSETVDMAKNAVVNVVETVKEKLSDAVDWVKETTTKAVSWIGDKISSMTSWVGGWFD